MAYMIYQQYTTAIRDGYMGRSDVLQHLERATAFREWIESLEIEHRIRGALAEQARVVEEAFAGIAAEGAAH